MNQAGMDTKQEGGGVNKKHIQRKHPPINRAHEISLDREREGNANK